MIVHRINNDGNYEPGNVRWATPPEQRANQRTRAWEYRRVAETVRRQIESGVLVPGDRVPSVTSLAARHQVTSSTAKALRSEGWIVTIPRKYAYVADRSTLPWRLSQAGWRR
jgi:DNA-binding GntR family transcriptional regulator